MFAHNTASAQSNANATERKKQPTRTLRPAADQAADYARNLQRAVGNQATLRAIARGKSPPALLPGRNDAAMRPLESAGPGDGAPAPTGHKCPACEAAARASAEQPAMRAAVWRSAGDATFQDAGAPSAPAAPAAPAAAGLGAGTPSVSWTGLNFSATATYTPCSDCNDGLEAIQVAWALGGPRTVGSHTTVFPPLAAVYDTFVDGGVNSPGGATYSGNHPYYIGRSDLPASYGYNSGAGHAGTVSGCTVSPSDRPSAALSWSEAYFETALVCLNYQGSGKDKLLNSVQWGFTGFGTVHSSDPRYQQPTAQVNSTPTYDFITTLNSDYPSYAYV